MISFIFQYFIVEQACYMYSMAIVPLYDTLGVEACSFIINQGEIKLLLMCMGTPFFPPFLQKGNNFFFPVCFLEGNSLS